MHVFSVGDRISVLGHTGTVRYVGTLPVWGTGVVAYGVEWDDGTRGKNSGQHHGILYFATATPNAGSFIKASNKLIDAPCLFFEAVERRYSSEANAAALVETMSLGSKPVESFGLARLNAIRNDVAALDVIMVDHQHICCAGVPVGSALAAGAGAPQFCARSLDLGSNLLADWTEVARILQYFPNLKSVSLNGNRISGRLDIKDAPQSVFPDTVTDVSLSATFVLLQALVSLDLLNVLPEALNVKGLTLLVLANNHIAHITKLPIFQHTLLLDLRRNPLNTYEEVDAIAQKFPNLRELRINDCPVFSGHSLDEMAFNLIGRLQCGAWAHGSIRAPRAICKLNGSYLLALDVANGELYFISRVKAGSLLFTNQTRWNELLRKYKASDDLGSTSHVAQTCRIHLSIRRASDPDCELFSRVFLQKCTVLRLKGIIAQQIQSYILDFSVFYYVNDDAAFGSREMLSDDIASLQSLGLIQNHRIYVL